MGAAESKVPASLHVIRVSAGSIASRHGLLPIFHFITAINGLPVLSEQDVSRLIETWKKEELVLHVYDSRVKDAFPVKICPQKDGQALGFGVKLHRGEMRPVTFKVLDVDYNSPGIKAGLIKDQDYIVGYEEGGFESEAEFDRVLYKSAGKPLFLLVYNVGMCSIRKVEIRVGDGDEMLGCELGTGIINEVPYVPGRIEIDARNLPDSSTIGSSQNDPSQAAPAHAPSEESALGEAVDEKAISANPRESCPISAPSADREDPDPRSETYGDASELFKEDYVPFLADPKPKADTRYQSDPERALEEESFQTDFPMDSIQEQNFFSD